MPKLIPEACTAKGTGLSVDAADGIGESEPSHQIGAADEPFVRTSLAASFSHKFTGLPIISRRLSRRGSIEVDGRSNTLIITDVRENIDAVRQLVAILDQPEPQVERSKPAS